MMRKITGFRKESKGDGDGDGKDEGEGAAAASVGSRSFAALPLESVCPGIPRRPSGSSLSTAPAPSGSAYEPGSGVARPVWKLIPSMAPVNFLTACGPSSGQPSSSL